MVPVKLVAYPLGKKGVKMKKLISRAATVAMLASMLTLTANAAGPTKPKLSFVKTNATIAWSNDVGSSPAGGPSNTNNQSLKINAIGVTGSSGASAYTYGNDEDLVGIRGLKLSQIAHLGFDTKGYLGAGAPRISLGTIGTNGAHTYFLAASHCNDVLSGGWVKADFIHDITNCEIFRDSEAVPYVGWVAVAAVADANNEVVVSNPNDWFLIVDEAPSTTYIDRLSVQEWCWTGNGTNGIINRNSGDCI